MERKLTPHEQLNVDIRILATINNVLPMMYGLMDALELEMEFTPSVTALELEREVIHRRFCGMI